jgi:hypothetical protein
MDQRRVACGNSGGESDGSQWQSVLGREKGPEWPVSASLGAVVLSAVYACWQAVVWG